MESATSLTPSQDPPISVLVLDDEESIRRLIKILLKQKGYEVDVAVNGRSGLEKLLRNKYDVVISDYRMAEMDGLTFIQEAKRIWPWLGMILISACVDDEVIEKGKQLGVHCFIPKPIPIEQLHVAVEEAAAVSRELLHTTPLSSNININRQLSLLRHVTELALRDQSLNQALDELAIGLQKLIGCDVVCALGVRDEDAALSIHARELMNPQAVAVVKQQVVDRYQALSGSLLSQKNLRIQVLGGEDSSSEVQEINHFMSVPVMGGEQVLGMLVLANRTEITSGSADYVFLYHVANHLATVLQAMGHIRQQTVVDPLTGVFNRNFFEAEVERIWAIARRYEHSMAVLMVDMDNFKQVNDQLGHQIGDRVIKTFAGRLKSLTRSSDMVVRYGGDEFVILMPEASRPEAVDLAKRILGDMATHYLSEMKDAKPMSCSIGIAIYEPGMKLFAPMKLVERADEALYSIKRSDKSHYAVWDPDEEEALEVEVEGEERNVAVPKSLPAPTHSDVLFVGPENEWSRQFVSWLGQAGYRAVHELNLEGAGHTLKKRNHSFSLLFFELSESNASMHSFLKTLAVANPILVPVCVALPSENSVGLVIQALRNGAYDVILFPADPMNGLRQLERALAHHQLLKQNREYQLNLEKSVQLKHKELSTSLSQVEDAHEFTLAAMVQMLDAREYETSSHSQRVMRLTQILAEHMGLDPSLRKEIARGALLHDIGKIAIPDSILRKPSGLTPEEVQVMRTHPEVGFGFLKKSSFLKVASEIVHCHHEAYDGRGYPRKLKGEEIPLGARIFSLVDSYDAMRSPRIYKGSISRDLAVQEVKDQSGRQFDPYIVSCFLEILDKLEEEAQWPTSTLVQDVS